MQHTFSFLLKAYITHSAPLPLTAVWAIVVCYVSSSLCSLRPLTCSRDEQRAAEVW